MTLRSHRASDVSVQSLCQLPHTQSAAIAGFLDRLIARGYMYKEIAARLHLSVKTVESHVSNVLRKLQLSTRHELARWATQHRLV